MPLEHFSLHTKLYFGQEPLAALEALKEQDVFLITDRFLHESGLTKAVTDRLKNRVTIFDQVTPDPSLELVAQGVLAFRESHAGVILAFGGGSPMDCAKAIRHFSGHSCPLWCVPTTAGTGSEVTSFAILSDTSQGVKHALVDHALLPDAAILDPAFLAGVPPKITADTGMDVLTHAAEAYVARGAKPFTDALAESAFVLAWKHLSAAHRGDPDAKAAMLKASCMAGMAFNVAGLGICHSMAHAIGGTHHIPHGRINAMLLPTVIQWHAELLPKVNRKYAHLAKRCGLTPTGRSLAAALRRLAASLGITDPLPRELDPVRISRQAMEDRCTAGDPAPVTADALRKILEGLK